MTSSGGAECSGLLCGEVCAEQGQQHSEDDQRRHHQDEGGQRWVLNPPALGEVGPVHLQEEVVSEGPHAAAPRDVGPVVHAVLQDVIGAFHVGPHTVRPVVRELQAAAELSETDLELGLKQRLVTV